MVTEPAVGNARLDGEPCVHISIVLGNLTVKLINPCGCLGGLNS